MWYRNFMNGKYDFIDLCYKHSNIVVGFNELQVSREQLYQELRSHLESLYDSLESFISANNLFKTTLTPWQEKTENLLVSNMIKYTNEGEVGPMASVAGAFADEILNKVMNYSANVFVENGGDVALKNTNDISVMIFPGSGSFQARAILKLPPGRWGIASSSGQFGPSLSLGEAEMVSVVAENSTRADSYATAIANQVAPGQDPQELLDSYTKLDALSIIWNGKMWYKGDFELTFER